MITRAGEDIVIFYMMTLFRVVLVKEAQRQSILISKCEFIGIGRNYTSGITWELFYINVNFLFFFLILYVY